MVPAEVKTHMSSCVEKGKTAQAEYEKMFAEYAKAYAELAKEITDALEGKLGIDLEILLPTFEQGTSMATRKASGEVLNTLMPLMPLVLGG